VLDVEFADEAGKPGDGDVEFDSIDGEVGPGAGVRRMSLVAARRRSALVVLPLPLLVVLVLVLVLVVVVVLAVPAVVLLLERTSCGGPSTGRGRPARLITGVSPTAASDGAPSVRPASAGVDDSTLRIPFSTNSDRSWSSLVGSAGD